MLRLRDNVGKAERLALRYLEKVRIPEQARIFPAKLSGGQQQHLRSSGAVFELAVMLFDAPTSALDPEMIRESWRC